jgi:hypothetical protein
MGSIPTYQRPDVPDHSRDRHSGEPTSVVTDQPKRRSRTVRDPTPSGATGSPSIVPFWDEVTDFYDWLFSHAS